MEPRIPSRYEMDLSDVNKLDIVAAAVCGWVSYYAYYDNADVWYRALLPASTVHRIPADPPTGRPQGWILKLPECNIVTFAGTTNRNQLYKYIMSCTFSPVLFAPAGTLCHSLWSKWGRNVNADFHTLIHETMADNTTLFCGHSAGGALAAIMLMQRVYDGVPVTKPVTCYTFGCPRVGNRKFADLSSGWFNIVQPLDPVPKLPFAGMVSFGNPLASIPEYGADPSRNFTRHGQVWYLKDNGVVIAQSDAFDTRKTDNSMPWDAAKVLAASPIAMDRRRFPTPGKPVMDYINDSLDNHMMADYLRDLLLTIATWDNGGIDGWREESMRIEQQLPAPPNEPPPMVTIPFDTPAVIDTGVTPLRVRRRH